MQGRGDETEVDRFCAQCLIPEADAFKLILIWLMRAFSFLPEAWWSQELFFLCRPINKLACYRVWGHVVTIQLNT